MSLIAYPEPLRAAYLRRIASVVRGVRVPGGDVSVWLAPVPTATLAALLIWPPGRIAELLFIATGSARLAGRAHVDPVQDLYAGDRTNIPDGVLADCAVMVWATLRLARLDCAIGNASAARDQLHDLSRRLQNWAPALAHRFAPQIADLQAQADALCALTPADAVA